MDINEKIKLVSEVGQEILTVEELKTLFEQKKHPVAYDGFEPSGKVHIAQGIMRVINVNKMIKAGCKFKMLAADWHAWANNKLSGDLEKIQTTGKYLIEVWKASGMNEDVEYIWANDAMSDVDYWKDVMTIARMSTVSRVVRCSQIMGRSESDSLSAAQIFYPCMQCADIFHLGVDICQLGMDQRKVNVLARELGEKIRKWKPVAVHHHMLIGLNPPIGKSGIDKAIDQKMSKSNPDSAIFMTDSSDEVKRKISKAYCPEKTEQDNPMLEYCKYILFEKSDSIEIKRPAKFGGATSFSTYQELGDAYLAGQIHPLDLKNAVAEGINNLLEPVHKHFEKPHARKLLEDVNSFQITR